MRFGGKTCQHPPAPILVSATLLADNTAPKGTLLGGRFECDDAALIAGDDAIEIGLALKQAAITTLINLAAEDGVLFGGIGIFLYVYAKRGNCLSLYGPNVEIVTDGYRQQSPACPPEFL